MTHRWRPGERLLWGVAWLALLAAYIAVPLGHLNSYAYDYDEGPQLQAAALANAGHPLYAEVVINKPPLLTWVLQLAFRLGATSIPTARLAMLLVAVVGLVALGLLSEQWWGRWSGIAAMLLLLILPDTSVRATAVTNDLPAMAAALVALVAATRPGQRWGWLALSAVAYAAMLGFHPILAPLIAPIVAALWMQPRQRPAWARLAVFGAIVAALALLVLLVVDRRGLMRWVVAYNAAPAMPGQSISTVTWGSILGPYLATHWPLGALAAAGVALSVRDARLRRPALIGGLWLLATVAGLAISGIPRGHYLIFVSFPLAALGGQAVVAGIRAAQQLVQRRRAQWPTLATAILPALGVWLVTQRIVTPPAWPEWTVEQTAARAAISAPETASYVVTDDQFLAFAAGRLVPPSLTDTSFKRIETGFLRTADVVGALVEHDVNEVLLGTGRLSSLSGFTDWLAKIGAGVQDLGGIRSYQLGARSTPEHPLYARLGNDIELVGYSLSESDTLQAGRAFTVTLYWRSAGQPVSDLTVFVHVLDAEGHLVAQHDGPPLLGGYPTSAWTPGIVVPDPHPVSWETAAPTGPVELAAGLYRQPALERLPAYRPDGSLWPDNRVVLTTAHLAPTE